MSVKRKKNRWKIMILSRKIHIVWERLTESWANVYIPHQKQQSKDQSMGNTPLAHPKTSKNMFKTHKTGEIHTFKPDLYAS